MFHSFLARRRKKTPAINHEVAKGKPQRISAINPRMLWSPALSRNLVIILAALQIANVPVWMLFVIVMVAPKCKAAAAKNLPSYSGSLVLAAVAIGFILELYFENLFIYAISVMNTRKYVDTPLQDNGRIVIEYAQSTIPWPVFGFWVNLFQPPEKQKPTFFIGDDCSYFHEGRWREGYISAIDPQRVTFTIYPFEGEEKGQRAIFAKDESTKYLRPPKQRTTELSLGDLQGVWSGLDRFFNVSDKRVSFSEPFDPLLDTETVKLKFQYGGWALQAAPKWKLSQTMSTPNRLVWHRKQLKKRDRDKIDKYKVKLPEEMIWILHQKPDGKKMEKIDDVLPPPPKERFINVSFLEGVLKFQGTDALFICLAVWLAITLEKLPFITSDNCVPCGRMFLATLTATRVLRTILFMTTVLPSPRDNCFMQRFEEQNSLWDHFLAAQFVKAGGGCNDLLPSGHSVFMTTCVISLTHYVMKQFWQKAALNLILSFSWCQIVVSKHHYTVDVILGYVLTNLIWMNLVARGWDVNFGGEPCSRKAMTNVQYFVSIMIWIIPVAAFILNFDV